MDYLILDPEATDTLILDPAAEFFLILDTFYVASDGFYIDEALCGSLIAAAAIGEFGVVNYAFGNLIPAAGVGRLIADGIVGTLGE